MPKSSICGGLGQIWLGEARGYWLYVCLCGCFGDAGGCPAATYVLCFAKESRQRKATRGSSPRNPLHRIPVQQARSVASRNPCFTLRYSKRQAAAELGLEWVRRKRSSLCSPSDSPRGRPLSFSRYSATLIGNPACSRSSEPPACKKSDSEASIRSNGYIHCIIL